MKTNYSLRLFTTLGLVVFLFISVSAQVYTRGGNRSYLIPGWSTCNGGTYWDTGMLGSLTGSSRGITQFTSTYTDAPFLPTGVNDRNSAPGYFIKSYFDETKTSIINVYAGQEFTISGSTRQPGHVGWANATLFIDWDGNGSFDDHDPMLYNLYGDSDCSTEEWAGNGNSEEKRLKPSWTIKVPSTFTKETTVRVRIKNDEGVGEAMKLRANAININGSVQNAVNGGCANNAGNALRVNQYFFSMLLHRFMPSGQLYRGQTTDVSLHIIPDPTNGVTALPETTIVGVGKVLTSCYTPVAGSTAIATEQDFVDFLNATTGNFHLTNDIVISSALRGSTSEFGGTFDGNGHTITINPTTINKIFTAESVDECFFPYGTTDAAIRANLLANNQRTPEIDDLTGFPQKIIAGGFCGKLTKTGTIKNVSIIYTKSVNYSNSVANKGMIFGLITGINKGRIENVSVDIQNGQQVNVATTYTAVSPSACGAFAGILYRGIIKNCTFNLDGTFRLCRYSGGVLTNGLVSNQSCMGGFAGRLQAGVMSNLNFSGAGNMSFGVVATANVRSCMGGIAGMTYTPQGAYANSTFAQATCWGYDNGTVGLDVNNVILSYSGTMQSESGQTPGASYNAFCRGLLFGEATDTITVPNLVTQYAARPTIQANASDANSLAVPNIPLISRTFGSCNSAVIAVDKRVGQLYLYRDGRWADGNNDKFMNVTAPDTKLDFAYNVDQTNCSMFARPYIVATNTAGTATNISNPSGSNVTCEGQDANGITFVKITTEPGADVNWTWTNSAYIPATPAVSTTFDCANPAVRHGYCADADKHTGGTAIHNETEWNAIGTTGEYYLEADLVLDNAFSKPDFNGTLYGNGHTITFTGLGTPATSTNTYTYAGGLFRSGAATINDLNIVYDWTGNKTLGLGTVGDRVAGLIIGAGNCSINNCSVTIKNGTQLTVSGGTGGVGIGGVMGTSIGQGSINNVTVTNNGVLHVLGGWPWIGGFVASTKTSGFTGRNLILRGEGTFSSTSANNRRIGGICVLNGGTNTVDGFVYDFHGTMDADALNRLSVTDGGGGNLNVTHYYAMDNATGATGQTSVPTFIASKLIASPLIASAKSMTRSYNNGLNQQNRYFKKVTTTGTLTPTVFDATTQAELPYTAYTVVNALEGGAVIDKTNTPIKVAQGTSSFNMTMTGWTANAGGYTSQLKWTQQAYFIDWNNDGDFADANEISAKTTGNGMPNAVLETEITFIVNVPTGQIPGKYRMRVVNLEPTGNADAWQNTLFDVATPDIRNGVAYDFAIHVTPFFELSTDADKNNITPWLKDGHLYLSSCDASPLNDTKKWISTMQESQNIITKNDVTVTGTTGVVFVGATTPTYVGKTISVVLEEKPSPNLTVRIGEEGGGKVSDDMGKTTKYTFTYTDYNSATDFITAVPEGPCSFEGWYLSTDGGTTFTAVPDPEGKYVDYTYKGTVDAVIEARFGFEDYEGNFGTYKFTDNTTTPFYISSIGTTGATINVPANTGAFSATEVVAGRPRWKMLPNEKVAVRFIGHKAETATVTVNVANTANAGENTYLLCFIDWNNNRYFDFDSAPTGMTKDLTPNKELIGVQKVKGTNTFTFTFPNTEAKIFGITRMRFFMGTYVDIYGLGPVNQYNNLNFRYSTDADFKTSEGTIVLNDNNGTTFTPNNQMNKDQYVNVLDVNLEVLAWISAGTEWKIKPGESVQVNDLIIETKETMTGPVSGYITFDPGTPGGSIHVNGHLIVHQQIYQNKWHQVSFPMEMQGTDGPKGMISYKDGEEVPITTWTTRTFSSQQRDVAGNSASFGAQTQVAKFLANSTVDAVTGFINGMQNFYMFAADAHNTHYEIDNNAVVGNYDTGVGETKKYAWIRFTSVDNDFTLLAKEAKQAQLTLARHETSPNYWDKNVNALGNPYFSPIKVGDITASLGWENVAVWNAKLNRYEYISAGEKTRWLYPHIGYWIQMTETDAAGGSTIKLGKGSYAQAEDGHVTMSKVMRRTVDAAFDTPDSYTLGIDRLADKDNRISASSAVVTLTDDGSVEQFRAAYDMPISLIPNETSVPEVWTLAGNTRMVLNDVKRAQTVTLPIGLRIREMGTYILRLNHTNSESSLVEVHDKAFNSYAPLYKNGEYLPYEFTADAGDVENRFELVINRAPQASTGLNLVNEQGAASQIYVDGNQLNIRNAQGAVISVSDVLGREINRAQIQSDEVLLPLPAHGVYLVTLRSNTGAFLQTVKVTN